MPDNKYHSKYKQCPLNKNTCVLYLRQKRTCVCVWAYVYDTFLETCCMQNCDALDKFWRCVTSENVQFWAHMMSNTNIEMPIFITLLWILSIIINISIWATVYCRHIYSHVYKSGCKIVFICGLYLGCAWYASTRCLYTTAYFLHLNETWVHFIGYIGSSNGM